MSFDDRTLRNALAHLKRRDPVLAGVIRSVGPCRIQRRRQRFQLLVSSIIAQQISGKAAQSIRRRLQATLRPERVTPAAVAALSTQQLRAAGLSPQKTSYLHDLAAKVRDGTVRLDRVHRMSDEEVIAELIQVKGIGVWTAQMFLMFSLGRPDVFPHDDLGIRAALRKLYGLADLPRREESLAIAEPWRPYATIACWYCWRSLDLRNGGEL
jgi:DNA-3-methyladenine glycosylase II